MLGDIARSNFKFSWHTYPRRSGAYASMDHSPSCVDLCPQCKTWALPPRENSAKALCRSRHTLASEPSKLGYIDGPGFPLLVHMNTVAQILLGSRSLDDDTDDDKDKEGCECAESESDFTEARSLHTLLTCRHDIEVNQHVSLHSNLET